MPYVPSGRPRGRPKRDPAVPPPLPRPPAKRVLPMREVIDPEELRFLRVYLAFGERDRTEAYRRAYHRKNHRGEWIDMPRGANLSDNELRDAPLLKPETANERSKAMMKHKYIQEALEELKKTPAEHARQTLADQILFGTSSEKKEAVKQIFADEDKLGFKDASDKWAEIMCGAGAEVVVPLGVIRRTVLCSHCTEASEVDIDLAVEIPLLGLFPQHANSSADAAN